jgi:heptosyltransferase-1
LRILLIRTSALGDIVHCLPVLEALRAALPEARIGWLVEKVWSPLLEGHPDLDGRFLVNTKAWRKKPLAGSTRGDVRAAVAAMRAFAPEVAIDLMGNFKGGFLARLSGAKRRIGAAADGRREGGSAIFLNEKVPARGEHAIDRALSLLAPLGIGAPAVDLGGDKLLRQAPPEAEVFLGDQRRSGKPLVLLQAGAGWVNKMYPLESWARVARGLAGDGADVVLPSAPGEEQLAARLAELAGGAARVVDAKPFPFLAALIRGCRLFLGGDTGPLHLAHAMGAKVLCIIGPTDPRRNGPYRAPERTIFRELPCSYCYKRFDEAKACLLQYPPELVLGRARELLAEGER